MFKSPIFIVCPQDSCAHSTPQRAFLTLLLVLLMHAENIAGELFQAHLCMDMSFALEATTLWERTHLFVLFWHAGASTDDKKVRNTTTARAVFFVILWKHPLPLPVL